MNAKAKVEAGAKDNAKAEAKAEAGAQAHAQAEAKAEAITKDEAHTGTQTVVNAEVEAKSKDGAEAEENAQAKAKANAEAERAVQSVQGMAGTFSESVETETGAAIPPNHPVMAWIFEHSADILNLFRRSSGGDGFTTYQMLQCRQWKVESPPFGDVIEFRRKAEGTLYIPWCPRNYHRKDRGNGGPNLFWPVGEEKAGGVEVE